MSDLRTPEQTAAFLCVSPGTLANWRVTGAGPTFIKVGRKVAYRTTDVLAWLESNARQNTSHHTAPTARQAGLSRRTPTPAVESVAAGAEVPRG